ncbi:hypothetical protein ERO13_D02G168032v2 [Gossypium hirsutum]|nr:hypothetical protein ERO13_D02G168032v2 [Gossypium hirsutum]
METTTAIITPVRSRVLWLEKVLQLLIYNSLKDVKDSRPGKSTNFSQFVRFNSCNPFILERSDNVANDIQFARFNFYKLEGSGGRD